MNKENDIDALIERCGEVRVLERLVAHFDHLYQEGVVRPERERERIVGQLIYLGERISADR
jgi:hypothetical protein